MPCEATAQKVFSNANITVTPATFGADVRSVLTTVELGEADAGMVYVTDAQAAGTRMKDVRIPMAQNASTAYPIAVLTHVPSLTAQNDYARSSHAWASSS